MAFSNDNNKQETIDKAIAIAIQYGGIDGSHHKAWVIDQMLRTLAGDNYQQLIEEEYTDQGDEWSTGIAP